ncbi:chromate efflux transporter [Legionella sp.]|uniref:chromate efflux transporter n=1 Tax=Legionella sp. TaxID=459 RepID=UPI003CA94A2B
MKCVWGNKRFLRTIEVFLIFLRLGLTSFGGPIAHLSYFRQEFVERRKWLSEHAYVDLVALCQLLPGPASSQVGIAIGLSRAGYLGAIVAWLGFTLPSAIILVFFAFGLTEVGSSIYSGWLHGLKIVAVAVVAQAVWSMTKALCPDLARITFAIVGALIASIFPNTLGQVAVIFGGGLIGWLLLKNEAVLPHADFPITVGKLSGIIALVLFFSLFILLPALTKIYHNNFIYLSEGFFRAGSLVFGGGHVVLPLLQSVVVPVGLVTNDMFLAGYGAAQAMPGPLFSFAAYLGAISKLQPNGLLGASICLIAIYLPSFLLIIGILPFWEKFRRYQAMKQAMQGINAVVVGLLLAALYNPVWTNAIYNIVDFSVALWAFLLLNFWKWPAWFVVLIGACIGRIISV